MIGRLEVCVNGEWKGMCSQRFNKMDATVVCRELGFSDKGTPLTRSGPLLVYTCIQVLGQSTLASKEAFLAVFGSMTPYVMEARRAF